MKRISLVISIVVVTSFASCRNRATDQPAPGTTPIQATPIIIPVSAGFDYPFGTVDPKRKRDKVGWYDAQKFGENDHLGEDWNLLTCGDSDCGLPVYAAAEGAIVFADEAGPGWGKVIIVRHRLPDGTLIETLYGRLQSFARSNGNVNRRERIGSVGNGDGAYQCHLHFEVRLSNCPAWGKAGPGYSKDNGGWTAPSDFIDANR